MVVWEISLLCIIMSTQIRTIDLSRMYHDQDQDVILVTGYSTENEVSICSFVSVEFGSVTGHVALLVIHVRDVSTKLDPFFEVKSTNPNPAFSCRSSTTSTHQSYWVQSEPCHFL
jgi:hypothetical protein